MKKIPDRWLPYQPVGKRIPGTRFISFKVPLKTTICDTMTANQRFTPQMLMENYPGVQLVVDLTNTNRYYDSRTFTDAGVAYKKILTPGQVIPSKHCILEFFRTVDQFFASAEDDESLIGVHCTHGLNRTSYFVCCYMIHNLGFNPEEAVAAFETARGHKIERLNYVADLINGGMGSDDQGSWGSRGRATEHTATGERGARWKQDSRPWNSEQRHPPAEKQNWRSRPNEPPPSVNGNQRHRPHGAAHQQYPSSNRPNQQYRPRQEPSQQLPRTEQSYTPRHKQYRPYPPNSHRDDARYGPSQQSYPDKQWSAGGYQGPTSGSNQRYARSRGAGQSSGTRDRGLRIPDAGQSSRSEWLRE